MSKKKKGRQEAAQGVSEWNSNANGAAFNVDFLVKPGRLNRQTKRTWKRGRK
ncbi:hypothetical protein [Propionivibrio sp.]|uniref:hypothetical protein n=1 Tax=Propionivibrio sp. TaxID=2212460 RepID=UPI00272E939F|nr:hypothetical protein [Propionivibrio sp.]